MQLKTSLQHFQRRRYLVLYKIYAALSQQCALSKTKILLRHHEYERLTARVLCMSPKACVKFRQFNEFDCGKIREIVG